MNNSFDIFSGALGVFFGIVALVLAALWVAFPLILYVYIRRLEKTGRESLEQLKLIQFYCRKNAELIERAQSPDDQQ